jgi:hydrogenase-4 membrane subunit HyfE
MKNLYQILLISIIGRADGNTSIYVSDKSLILMVLEILLIVFIKFLIIFSVYKFVQNIKHKDIKKSVLFGSVVMLALIVFISGLFEVFSDLKNIKMINQDEKFNAEKGSVEIFYDNNESLSEEILSTTVLVD